MQPRHPSCPRPQPGSRRSDIARRLGAAKSTAHRLLTMCAAAASRKRSRPPARRSRAGPRAAPAPAKRSRTSTLPLRRPAGPPDSRPARTPTTCTASDFEQAPAQCAAPVTPPPSVRRSSAAPQWLPAPLDRSGRACAAVALVT
ncbi:helix-turn-helix domain-containing protein [Streptomyces sp. NPDC006654]|uniref:helix-turn-helix domain-containing protein n=1 Tax=Streptomyces sp. NPDC006654 TaxID=3156897 RepID=UPI0033F2EADF